MSKDCLLIVIIIIFCSISSAWATDSERFNYSGDGVLAIDQQTVRFRDTNGNYDEGGLKKIHQIFNANWDQMEERLSLRFIEFLDYLQDQLHGGSYHLKSGYRSPTYNQSLRNRGKLAAQSSMHTEGAAADLSLNGIPSSQVFDFIKSLNCCGIGWYHSQHFHLDTGPARFWDEATSKTEDKTPQQNEKIILQPDYDRYHLGETIDLKFMRVTEYPIGVPSTFELVGVPENGNPKKFNANIQFANDVPDDKGCRTVMNRKQGRTLQVKLLAKGLGPGAYALKLRFCNRYDYQKMPEEIISKTFEVIK